MCFRRYYIATKGFLCIKNKFCCDSCKILCVISKSLDKHGKISYNKCVSYKIQNLLIKSRKRKMGTKRNMRSILFTLVIMAVLILLIFIPVSAADEEAAKTSTDSISANNTIFTTSSQILPNGVYRIFNWSSLQSLKVEGYGITNNTNVFCE